MSERARICDWCKGTGKLQGKDGCGLCGDTGMIAHSIGDLPQSTPRKFKSDSKNALEKAVLQINQGKIK